MPTYNRRAFVPHAIRYFLRQDYPEKELIILDDGTDSIRDLIPDHPALRYYRLPEKITLGAKMNMACKLAKGNIIANWDDDDWYAQRRLSYQATAMKQPSTFICGINRLLYFDLGSKDTYEYIYPANQRTWMLGSSLCFRKDFWEQHPFADINVGMDGLFVWSTTNEHLQVLADHTFSVHMIHPHNVSPKRTNTSWWHLRKPDQVRDIMGDDWNIYSKNGNEPLAIDKLPAGYTIKEKTGTKRTVKNIYACLVHEKKECVEDLVRNLHHYDPSSVIILYNGGTDPSVLQLDFSFHTGGVLVCPDPVPVKWGYLHSFALHCMEFALQQFSFTAFTVVDSDQLCVRKNYGTYISAYLESKPGTGMLSPVTGKIAQDDRTNPVALQAYKEFDLWQPLLLTFPGGESKFVHWTFWPSTVFTRAAAESLVTLFRENKMLQEIMRQTKIWATEEVIFPTLVKLLGYGVEQNPCSYEYVKYKTPYSTRQVREALSKSSVYWMHPVPRKYMDPVRKLIRDQSNEYRLFNTVSNNSIQLTASDRKILIRSLDKIQGWLSDAEADLLITFLLKAITDTPPGAAVVETGSYHGKATVLLGTLIKQFSPRRKLIAADTHDGKLGDTEKGLTVYPPSRNMFEKNIEAAGLMNIVEPVYKPTAEIQWNTPVSFLLIDWLHDYHHVMTDFNAFAACVQPGGYIAFHDYAPYYSGVMKFADELLEKGVYKKTAQAASLLIIQKNDE
jgi:glycosyltransferase involved in cell wall biosynthesis